MTFCSVLVGVCVCFVCRCSFSSGSCFVGGSCFVDCVLVGVCVL